MIGIRQQFVAACARHETFVLLVKCRKGHRVGAFDHRHHQAPSAVLAFDVDGETQVHGTRIEPVRLSFHIYHGPNHRRERLRSEYDGPSDQVGERKLESTSLELIVESLADVPKERSLHIAERCGRGYAQAGLHVL